MAAARTISWDPVAVEELRQVPMYYRRRIHAAIVRELPDRADLASPPRKFMPGIRPPWSPEDGVWQLTVGQYRVFYDVEPREIIVRAVRKKGRSRTIEIL
jgi:mRNA-degrading endonuclease RelE of RelBE toxin-antitoxin system